LGSLAFSDPVRCVDAKRRSKERSVAGVTPGAFIRSMGVD
jgi:hypothetical protein